MTERESQIELESKYLSNVQPSRAMREEEEPLEFAPLATPEVAKPGMPSMNRVPVARPGSKGQVPNDANKQVAERQSELEAGLAGTVAFRSQGDSKLAFKPFKLEPTPIMSLHNRQGANTETGQVAFSTDSTAIALSDKNIVCLNVVNNYQRFLIGHDCKVSCLAVVPDDNLLVSIDEGETPEVIVWRIVPARVLCRFKLDMTRVHSVACCKFLKDGK